MKRVHRLPEMSRRHGLLARAGPLLPVVAAVVSMLVGCGIPPFHRYLYRFQPLAPLDQERRFEDSIIAITFKIESRPSKIVFSLTNKTDEPLAVDWEKSRYIDARGNQHQVTHAGRHFYDKGIHPPTSIAPGATHLDMVIPREHAQGDLFISDTPLYEPGYAIVKWNAVPLLPQDQDRHEEIMGLEGTTIGIVLAVIARGQAQTYRFEFRIREIIHETNAPGGS